MSVKVGLVSFAHVHSPAYAAVLRELDAADFVGITDEVADRGKEAAEQYGVRFFDSNDSLYEEVDAVVVCSENKYHVRDVIPALHGGVHVLCEKPISTTVEDASAMIQASETSGSQLRTAFPVRYQRHEPRPDPGRLVSRPRACRRRRGDGPHRPPRRHSALDARRRGQ